jgi:hypothetical protein
MHGLACHHQARWAIRSRIVARGGPVSFLPPTGKRAQSLRLPILSAGQPAIIEIRQQGPSCNRSLHDSFRPSVSIGENGAMVDIGRSPPLPSHYSFPPRYGYDREATARAQTTAGSLFVRDGPHRHHGATALARRRLSHSHPTCSNDLALRSSWIVPMPEVKTGCLFSRLTVCALLRWRYPHRQFDIFGKGDRQVALVRRPDTRQIVGTPLGIIGDDQRANPQSLLDQRQDV